MAKLLLFCSVFMMTSLVHADSLFAVNGFGQWLHPVDERARAMGGAALAVEGGFSALNPSTAMVTERARIGVAMTPELLEVRTDTVAQDRAGFRLSIARGLFPVGDAGTLSLGLHPLGTFNAPKMVSFVNATDEIPGHFSSFESVGDLSAFGIGYAHAIGKVTLGFRTDALFGSAVETWTMDFAADTVFVDASERAVLIRDAIDHVETNVLGMQFSGGMTVRVSPRWTAGAYVVVRPWASGHEIVDGGSAGTEVNRTVEYDLPMQAGFGIAYHPTETFLAAVDFETALWSQARVDRQPRSEFVDSQRFGLGVEWYVGSEDSWLARNLPLRCGLSSTTGSYETRALGRNDEQRISFGSGIPLLRGRGQLDFSLSYALRTADSVREHDYLLGVNLTILETWSRSL